jgi:hypothetical protein
MKLYKILLNELAGDPSKCGGNSVSSTTDFSLYEKYLKGSTHYAWQPDPALDEYKYCKKPVVSNGGGGSGSSDACVTGKKCPEDEGYSSLEFQEWVWTTHNKFAATGTQKSRLCGLTASPGCKATSCVKSKAVDGSCGNGTKAVWADLKNNFIAFKNASSGNLSQNNNQNQDQDQTVEVDEDLYELKMDMEVYRSLLDSYDFPSGWSSLDTLNPGTYTPRSLNIDLITKVKNQIIQFIKAKARSSEFSTFIKMLQALDDAYNNEKYKAFFQSKVDPKGADIFTTFNTYISEIEEQVEEMKSYNFDSLSDPTEEEIRDGLFKYIPKTVYNVNDVNLKMSVYFYTKTTPMVGTEEDLITALSSQLETTKTSTNEDTCRDLLGVYYQIYQKTEVKASMLNDTKEKIQDCWCKGFYNELGKIGFKKLYDKELRQGRKELLKFLSLLPSVTMDEFTIPLNNSVCKSIKKFR